MDNKRLRFAQLNQKAITSDVLTEFMTEDETLYKGFYLDKEKLGGLESPEEVDEYLQLIKEYK